MDKRMPVTVKIKSSGGNQVWFFMEPVPKSFGYPDISGIECCP